MILPCLFIAQTQQMGRGVFSAERLPAGTVVEISPVIVMNAADRVLLDQTLLYNYIFEWGDKENQCAMALGYISIYNHAYEANCDYDMDYTNATMTIKTVRHIKKGEELFINYNGNVNDARKVWFHQDQ